MGLQSNNSNVELYGAEFGQNIITTHRRLHRFWEAVYRELE